MFVQAAARVEWAFAGRAFRLAGKVFISAQFGPACAAEDGFLAKLALWPNLRGSAPVLFVAGEAGIVCTAAVELDGNAVNF